MKKLAIFLLCIGAVLMFSVSIALTVNSCSDNDKNTSSPYQDDDDEWVGPY